MIVLTTYETDRDILRAVEAGAAGYLLKDLPAAELADAVRAAARGETVLAPSVAARLVDQLRTKPERPRLSERETAVLRLVAEGCTNAEIGRRLFIGESTVKTHLLRAFGKLGVDDRTAAVTSAMRHGLLDLPMPMTKAPERPPRGIRRPSVTGWPSLATPVPLTISLTRDRRACSPDSMSLSWTTPSARSRSPATIVKRAPLRLAFFMAPLSPLAP